MNERIELSLISRKENEDKIKSYIKAVEDNKTVVIENWICLIESYSCDTLPGYSEWQFAFRIVDYVKGEK